LITDSTTGAQAPFRYPSKEFAGHFCVPDGKEYGSPELLNAFKDAFFNSVLGNKGSAYFYDIAATWQVLLVGGFATILIAYLYLFLIRWTAGIIVYAAIVVSELLLLAGFFYSYYSAREEYLKEDPTYDYITYTSYVFLGLAALLVLVTLFCFNAL